MSRPNSIARGAGDAGETASTGFEMPPELAGRYELRVVDGADGEQRLGLFRPTDRENPSIEISDDRIVARGEDAETIATLVKLAQANGWDRIAVEGSAEFRKALWTAATREGLSVSGYDATFAERERLAEARAPAAARSVSVELAPDQLVEAKPGDLSENDRRLLLTLSRHTEDRKALYGDLDARADAFQREVQFERIDLNRAALAGSLDQALESPTLAKAFERAGYQADGLREMGRGGEWDTQIADAVYLVRSGLTRDDLEQRRAAASGSLDERAGELAETSIVASVVRADETPALATRSDERLRREANEHRVNDDEHLAELFLHGGDDTLRAEPRLASALQAQATMEQHIGEVFSGDSDRAASASLESRQMISDALRRGLDVAVREPTPVRQIEPARAHVELER